MKSIKDWVSCQFSTAKRFLPGSSLIYGFFNEQHSVEGAEEEGLSVETIAPELDSTDHSAQNAVDCQVVESSSSVDSHETVNSQHSIDILSEDLNPLVKLQELQLKYLRIIHRMGHSPQNPVVAHVLNRLHIACLIRAGESGILREEPQIDKAFRAAIQQETADQSNVNFSFKLLFLGKTGVGKSTTVNSIFGKSMAITNPFRPSTGCIQEVSGNIYGSNITIIDTPGLSSLCHKQRRNREILRYVKRFLWKSKPDMVLYFDRLDSLDSDVGDSSLLKLVSDVLGPEVWFNAILVMTHSGSSIPESLDGFALNYEEYVAHRRGMVQNFVNHAIDGVNLENPVLLVENHQSCRTNNRGEKILPNGQAWRLQFLLLCISTKVLGDASMFLKLQKSFLPKHTKTRMPSLPHLLTKFLQFLPSGPQEESTEFVDEDEIGEYDQLPPIRVLRKAEFKKLSKRQKIDYLNELDYREALYRKKQLKEEIRRRKEKMLFDVDDLTHKDESPNVSMLLPDMNIPPSFDSESPAYRYRFFIDGKNCWVARPVFDPQSWDHEVGFDAISLEFSEDITRNLHGKVAGQVRKEKHDFSLLTESAVEYTNPRGSHVLCAEFDLQTVGKDPLCFSCGELRFRNLKRNISGFGLSLISFGDKLFGGGKIDNSIPVGKRLKFTLNGGWIGGSNQGIHGGSIEAEFRGYDHPLKNESTSLGITRHDGMHACFYTYLFLCLSCFFFGTLSMIFGTCHAVLLPESDI